MKVQPLGDRLLVKVLEAKDETSGGIVLPDSAKEKPQEAKVIAAGKGKVNEDGKVVPLQVKVGEKILFGKYTGTEITVDDKEYLILKEEDVLAIIK